MNGKAQQGTKGTPVGTTAAPDVGTPAVGTLAVDTEQGRTGEVMGHVGGRVQLRPVGGGKEWDARPENVWAAAPCEALSARVAAANARSRGEIA